MPQNVCQTFFRQLLAQVLGAFGPLKKVASLCEIARIVNPKKVDEKKVGIHFVAWLLFSANFAPSLGNRVVEPWGA